MKRVLHIALILLACVVVYANSINVPFQWDGTYFIKENPAVRDFSYFFDSTKAQSTDFHQALSMRWVGYLTFALNYHTFEFRPWAYHLDNIALHCGNAVLLYMFMVLLMRTPFLSTSTQSRIRDIPALFAALLFAVHPLQTEAVTYIFQRLAALVTFFYLASAVLYLWARLATGKRQGLVLYALSLISAVLAMKTKENAFTLPFVLLLMEVLFLSGPSKQRVALLSPFALTLLIIPLSLTGIDKPLGEIIAGLGPSTRGVGAYTRGQYLLTQFPVLVKYLRLLVLPVGQNLDHFVTVETSLFSARVLGAVTVLGFLLSLGIYCMKRAKTHEANGHLMLVSFGIFWFFVTISVESGIVPIPQLMAEYRMYLPGVGLLIAATAGAYHFARTPQAIRLLSRALLAVVVILSMATVSRNTLWKDATELWGDVIAKNPQSTAGHNNLGISLMESGKNGQAIEHYRKAIDIRPEYADPYNNMGIALGNIGRPELAIDFYEKAISLDPKLYTAYNNMGNAYRDLGDMNRAMSNYQTAIALNPAYAEAHNNLGVAYAREVKGKEALKHLTRAVELKPEYTGAHFNLGILFLQLGRFDDARRELETVLSLSPGDLQARHVLKSLSTDSR